MATINTRKYPTESIYDGDKLPFYSTMQTGVAGTLVKIVTGTANPQNNMGFAAGSSVGFNYNTPGTYVFNQKYETKWKVTPTVSGDNSYNAIGFTDWSTLSQDNNLMQLNYNDRRALELGAVRSGEAVPVVTKAQVYALWGKEIDQSMGAVQPGNLVVVSRSGDGRVAAVDPTNATVFGTGGASFIYTPAHVIGKWLSSLPTSSNTGLANDWSSQGGFALFSFSLTK